MPNPNSGRAFNWLSSTDKNSEKFLIDLDEKMKAFYSDHLKRQTYQAMLEGAETEELDINSVRYQMPLYVFKSQPEKVLEIGCSNGKLYRLLKELGFKGKYTGIDLPEYIISQNKIEHPECDWFVASAYKLPFENNIFDIVFSLYVLEHLIFPEKALTEQLRVTKQGGKIVLVFPDFVCSGRLGSQQLGYSPGTFKTKIKKGHIIDALISLYDSRIRLPNALKKVISTRGNFPVNISPLCLNFPENISADVDATYIASKKEIMRWAAEKGYKVELPCGELEQFSEQSFIVINKTH
ncbi:MAG TPA: class I SAM-dependent methyltransferase [Parafilimonas sp.]|nr:class I SAM-dependent methyltransferase [Parafilimonas sp.]